MKPLQVLGKYELLQKIGAGGMAEVYLARLTGVEGFEKVVVVKKILPGYARNISFIKMLVDEAKLTSVLQHPNIVQIFELDHVDKQYYIAMEWVDGKDLLKVLARCAEQKAQPDINMSCFIAAEVCKGLDYAHRARDIYGKPLNIIHRDVSPSNIIVSWGGTVKIMDFGVAKARTQDTKGSKHVLRGKLGYMSPEQVKGEEIDHRSDIFSLGIVLFEALTLKRLFLGRTDLETLINIRDASIERKFTKYPYIDDGLKRILRRVLAADREERYATVMELHEDLTEYLFERKARITNSSIETYLKSVFGDEADKAAIIRERTGEVDVSQAESKEELDMRSLTSPGVPATAAKEARKMEEIVERTQREAAQAAPEQIVEEAVAPVEEEPQETKETETPKPRPKVRRSSPPPETEAFVQEFSSPKFGEEFSPVPASLKGHEFKLRNTSGYVFGPVDYSNLVNLLQTGAVSDEEFVSIDGGDWHRVKEITEVRKLSPNEALKSRGVTPIYSGTISRTGLIRVFYQVASRNLSGKLRFVRGSSQKEFFFRAGKPRHIASNLKQELLGSFLLHRQVVSEDQMNTALDKSGEFGGRVGDALVSLGYVKPHELYWLLDQQFREKFLEIFSWTRGRYEFYEGVPCPIDMAPSDANVFRYVLEGIRRYNKTKDLESLFRQHQGSAVKEKKNAYVSIEKLPLNSKERRLYTQIQRHGSFGKVLRESCPDEESQDSLYHTIVVLYQLELIEFQSR